MTTKKFAVLDDETIEAIVIGRALTAAGAMAVYKAWHVDHGMSEDDLILPSSMELRFASENPSGETAFEPHFA